MNRFLLLAPLGLLLIYGAGTFGEPVGTYLVLAGIVLFFGGGIFGCGGTEGFMKGVMNFVMLLAVVTFAWFVWIAAEHTGWVPKFFVDLPGPHHYGDGDFFRPLVLAAVFGIGFVALVGFLFKSGGGHGKKSEHS